MKSYQLFRWHTKRQRLRRDPAAKRPSDARECIPRVSRERPLRVLFLGQINLRKGVARLLEAARILRNEPVEFWMVGPVEIANASAIERSRRVKWFGPVTRKQATEYYRDADVFILPTLSDGFAITQLEAQAYGLPVIASKFCGNVVESGRQRNDSRGAECRVHRSRDSRLHRGSGSAAKACCRVTCA